MKIVELILNGSISGYLLKHTFIIFGGLITINSLVLVDLHFIGKFGSNEIAASILLLFRSQVLLQRLLYYFILYVLEKYQRTMQRFFKGNLSQKCCIVR